MTPIRYSLSTDFLASARDMGDRAMIDSATRVWWAIRYPRTKPCTPHDLEIFNEWVAQ